MKRVLIVGATGYLGQALCKAFHSSGYWVRALVRRAEQKQFIQHHCHDIIVAQATQADTISNICQGIDWVVSCLGITRQQDGMSYMDVDYQANLNVLHVAEKSGVERFLYVSALKGDELTHLQIFAAKERFVQALKGSPIAHHICRPSGFFSDLEEVLHLAKKGTAFVMADTKVNPIDGHDLAVQIVLQLESQITERCIGGPQVLTQREIALAAFAALKREPKIRKVPRWLNRLFFYVAKLSLPKQKFGPIEFFLTVLSQDMVGEKTGQKHLLTHYEEVLAAESTNEAVKKIAN